jgi:F-type H+-transporting ATPase subunit delta
MITGSLSKRYARALAGYAQAHNLDIEELAGDLAAISQLLTPGSKLHDFYTNRLISAEKKTEMLEKIIEAGEPSPLMANFLRLLMRKDRLILLPEIHREYRLLADNLQGIVRGEVQVAQDLPEEIMQSLKEQLGRLLSKEVILTISKNPKIIGGIIVRVGSLSFNGSLRAQLDSLKDKLIEEVTL